MHQLLFYTAAFLSIAFLYFSVSRSRILRSMHWSNTYNMGSIQSKTAKRDCGKKPDSRQQGKRQYPNQFESNTTRNYNFSKAQDKEWERKSNMHQFEPKNTRTDLYKNLDHREWEKQTFQDEQKPKTSKTEVQMKADKIISKCIWQNQIFREQQTTKNWRAIHEAHYDWWAFPVDDRSSYGDEYMVSESEINTMKQSPQFMEALQSNAFIVCRAWGWDLRNGQKIPTDHQDQKWQNWPIRLFKMIRSLEIFGLIKPFKNAVKYGVQIMKSGKHLQYGKRDISAYLTLKWTQIKANSSQISSLRQSQNNISANQKRSQLLGPKNLLETNKFKPKTGIQLNSIAYQRQHKNHECNLLGYRCFSKF